MEKMTMAAGVAIRYFDLGKGDKTILLVHGYLESIEIWEEYARELSDQFRVIGFDVPGHGISEVFSTTHSMNQLADIAAALLSSLGVKTCVAVGHSMGGYIVQALAARHTELLAGLVLFHSSPNPDTEEKRHNREREIELIKAGKKELLARTSPGKTFAPENRKKFQETIEDIGLQVMLTEDEGIMALLNGMMEREDLNDTIRQLSVPVLFIFGRQDELIPAGAAQQMGENHPEAEIVWLEHSGHMGFIEERERSVEILTQFAERCYR